MTSGFRKRFIRIFAFGLIGVASLPLVFVPALRAGALGGAMPDLPLPALVALMLVNPLVLLAIGAALGAALAPRVRLRSFIAMPEVKHEEPIALRSAAPLAVAFGLLLAAATVVLDLALAPLMSEQWSSAVAAQMQQPVLPALVTGMLYGGITEEILLRWGLMSLLMWAGWRLFAGGAAAPPPALAWGAILLAALAFGAGHLPAAAALAPLDAPLVLRTVLLNAIAGVVYGWLFWRRHLEAAMVAHASTHVGFALLRAAGAV
ncbi:MAG TPA: CPBP family intramembrane glutamic endopeptidase [Noviherbaspirillum sp.]|nr:CPBP family intramembrane glutamic endopeptidase [Noviherbaspirillum sp.]